MPLSVSAPLSLLPPLPPSPPSRRRSSSSSSFVLVVPFLFGRCRVAPGAQSFLPSGWGVRSFAVSRCLLGCGSLSCLLRSATARAPAHVCTLRFSSAVSANLCIVCGSGCLSVPLPLPLLPSSLVLGGLAPELFVLAAFARCRGVFRGMSCLFDLGCAGQPRFGAASSFEYGCAGRPRLGTASSFV